MRFASFRMKIGHTAAAIAIAAGGVGLILDRAQYFTDPTQQRLGLAAVMAWCA